MYICEKKDNNPKLLTITPRFDLPFSRIQFEDVSRSHPIHKTKITLTL